MRDFAKPGGFELEQRFPGTFILQGAFAGLLVGYLLLTLYALSLSAAQEILGWLIFVVLVMGVTTILSIPIAVLIWLPARFLRFEMKVPGRILVAFLAATIPFFVLALITHDTPGLVIAVVAGGVVGVAVGMLVGSRIRPWGFLTFGSIVISGKLGSRRITSRSILALLGTIPLRLVTILLLLVSLWALEWCLWQEYDTAESAFVAYLLIYSASSAYLSFRSPRRWILIAQGALLNLPIVLLVLYCYLQALASYANYQFLVAASVGTILPALWFLCVVSRTTIQVPTWPMPLNESEGRLMMCLGEQFSNCEQTLGIVSPD